MAFPTSSLIARTTSEAPSSERIQITWLLVILACIFFVTNMIDPLMPREIVDEKID
jgi:hypothetical protein